MTLADNLLILEKAGLISLAAVRPEPEFSFRHVLVQEAAYNTYLKSQRRQVHQVIAEVLEQSQSDPRPLEPEPDDLAYHYFEAGIWAKAMDYARQAGERAQARFAPREASLHFTLALEAAGHLGQPAPTGLLRARGLTHELLGDFERAHADFTTALAQARAEGRWQDEWQLLLDLGLLWASRGYARTGEYYRQALQLARSMGDDAILAHSLNRLGNWHFNAGENLAALSYHQEALVIFQRLQAQRGLAETFDFLGMVQTVIGQVRQGRANYEQAIALFREQDDRIGLISSLATLAEQGPTVFTDAAAFVVPAIEAHAWSTQALQIARQIGFRAGEAYALCSRGGLLVAQGDYAAALADVRTALHIAIEIGHRQWQAFAYNIYGMACLDLFQVDEAYHQLEPAHVIAHELGSAIWTAGTAAMLAFVYLARGEIALAETLLAEHSAANDAPSMQERLLTIARTELALAQGRPGSALDLLDGLIAMAPGREPGQIIPRLWYLRGRAKAAAGHTDAAIADFQAACTASLRLGTRPLAWRIQGELARLYQAQGRHAEADAHRAAARALVESLAASVPEPAWRDHFQQQAFRLLDL